MGEGFQEVIFWRWLMDIQKLKVLVFRQFFLYIIVARLYIIGPWLYIIGLSNETWLYIIRVGLIRLRLYIIRLPIIYNPTRFFRIVIILIPRLHAQSSYYDDWDRNHRDRLRDVRWSHLPIQLEPLGAGGSCGIMVTVFFCFQCLCCWSEREEERAPLLRQSVVALSRIRKTSTYKGCGM